jgi:dolichol-phosphate mannosyltransferase
VKLSIVIPARNEAANIGPTVDRIRDRLRGEGIAYDMVVVDDGSSDFGYAVRRGLEAFTGDAVAIVMADGSDSPDDLVRYYYIVRARAECACPVRCGQPGESDRQPVSSGYCSVSGTTT